MSDFVLSEENYYTTDANKLFCSASQYKDFFGCPMIPGCPARAMSTINGEYEPETTKALLIGSILDALWEGARSDELAVRFPECVSTRGATKGELKAEFKQAIQLYERTYKDEKFRTYMSGEKQTIMTGEIGGLPFKIKMDSFIDGKAIVDLKTTENADPDFRLYIKDSGERLPFYLAWGYHTQLAIYREIVRQNTGSKLECYIAAVDKKSHPKPILINMESKLLDGELETIKRSAESILDFKSGKREAYRCDRDGCDFCRDSYECTVISTSEFEAHDIERGAI